MVVICSIYYFFVVLLLCTQLIMRSFLRSYFISSILFAHGFRFFTSLLFSLFALSLSFCLFIVCIYYFALCNVHSSFGETELARSTKTLALKVLGNFCFSSTDSIQNVPIFALLLSIIYMNVYSFAHE